MADYTYKHPRPVVTVDCVVFGLSDFGDLEVLLIKRLKEPFKGMWVLPGGHVEVSDESLEGAAHRELTEETQLQINYLEQLYTFGDPGRDPRGRTISVSYFGLVRKQTVSPGSDAAEVGWFSVKETLKHKTLAFDHVEILDMAYKRLQMKVRYAPLGFSLLPEKFTLSQLQTMYETILGRPIDKRNFRKKVLKLGILQQAGRTVTKGRPAQLFRFDRAAYDKAARDRFNFEI